MFRIALRTLRFRKGAFVATFLAMAFGATLVTACGGLMETGIRKDVPAQRLAAASLVVTGHQSYKVPDPADPEHDIDGGNLPELVRLNAGLVKQIQSVPGVRSAVGDMSFPTKLRSGASAVGHGWDSAQLTPYRLRAGVAPQHGQVVLDSELGVGVGDRVELAAGTHTETFTVSGVATGKSPQPSIFFADADAERLAGHPGRVDAIGILTDQGTALGPVKALVGRILSGQRAVLLAGDDRGTAEFPESAAAGASLIALAAVFGGLAMSVALYVVATTLGLSIQQRQRELALLRAIGTTPGQLRRMAIGEALFMSLFATALGSLAGVWFGRWLFVQMAGNGLVPAGMVFHSGWPPMAVAVGSGLLTSLVAGYIASRRAARTRPTEALTEATIQRKWLSWPRAVCAVLTLGGGLALSLVTFAVMTGPVAASTAGPSVMLWAIGLTLLSPGITRMLLAVLRLPVRALTGAAGYLATLSARTRAVRMAAVIAPIMLATGVATATIYLQTTQVAVSQEAFVENLRADLVLNSATGGLAPDLVGKVRQVPGVAAASEFATSTVHVTKPDDDSLSQDALPVQGVSADGADRTTAVKISKGSLTQLQGRTVALPEQEATVLDRGVGDTITVTMGDGTPVDVRIVALYPAQEGSQTLLMPAGLVASHTTAGAPSQIMVRAQSGVDVDRLGARLAHLVADRPGVTVMDRAALAAEHAQDQRTAAWINYLLAGMITIYTAISLVNSVMTSTTARRREFGLQRLTGSTRGQVLRMMALEAGMTAFIGALLGTIAAAAALVPFTLATDGSLLPTGPVWIYLGVVGATATLTFGATLMSTWVGLRARPAGAALALA